MQTEKKLTKARVSLLMNFPWIGAPALKLELIADPSVKTMCTNGKRIRYSPEFVKTKSIDFLKSAIAHEVWHTMLLHHTRRGDRNEIKWNVACDYVVNEMLVLSKMYVGDGWFCDINFFGFSAEKIYDLLPDLSDDSQSQGPGDVEDFEGTPDEVKREEESWEITKQQVFNSDLYAGSLPKGLKRIVEKFFAPKISWREHLRMFFDEVAKNDYTWTSPNRRYMANDIYLPNLLSHELGRICIAVDTSGSISKDMLDQFAAEVSGILAEFSSIKATVMYCDSKVYEDHIQEFHSSDLPITLDAIGSGGTRFMPVFDYIDTQYLEDPPKGLIYLTDMFPGDRTELKSYQPDYSVLWVDIHGGSPFANQVPFGQVIGLEV